MLNRLFIVLTLLTGCGLDLSAQNLIRNHGFEEITSCADVGVAPAVLHWWNADVNGSVDYFNRCDQTGFWGVPNNIADYQEAFENGYIGLAHSVTGTVFNFFREYFESQLQTALVPNKKYCYRQFLVAIGSSRWGSDGFGVYFSDTMLSCNLCYFPVSPQVEWPDSLPITDTLNWLQLSGSFVAAGGENFITIGCFRPDSLIFKIEKNSSSPYCCGVYYFIDELSLTLCRPPVLADDTTIVFGNSISIGDTAQDVANYYWTPSIGLSCDTCWQTIATPAETTTYTLTKITPCDTTSSQITISVREPDFTNYSFTLSPNPSNGIVQVNYTSNQEVELRIYNSIGQVIQSAILPASTIGQSQIDLSTLSKGVYIMKFGVGNTLLHTEKILLVE